jgi:hypothetical protein
MALLPTVLSILILVASPGAAQNEPDPPPHSDTFTTFTQFLVCSGNPYALCYYSGPKDEAGTKEPVPSLPCTLRERGDFADCACYAIEDGSTNYVLVTSILNADVREETVNQCGEDGSGCLNMLNQRCCEQSSKTDGDCQPAPVCDYLGDLATKTGQSLYPKGTLISTFSFAHARDYPFGSTPCDSGGLYAGCMTAPCGEPDSKGLVDCECPTYDGVYQIGQNSEIPSVTCDLALPNLWSAANNQATKPFPPQPPDCPSGD